MTGGKYFDLIRIIYTLTTEAGGARMDISGGYRFNIHYNGYAVPATERMIMNTAETLLKFYMNRAESYVRLEK